MGNIVWADGIGKISNIADLDRLLIKAATDAGAVALFAKVIYLPTDSSKPTSPPGGTAFCLLDESHISLHWYHDVRTSEDYFALDVFTCGVADPRIARDVVLNLIEARCIEHGSCKRFSMWDLRSKVLSAG